MIEFLKDYVIILSLILVWVILSTGYTAEDFLKILRRDIIYQTDSIDIADLIKQTTIQFEIKPEVNLTNDDAIYYLIYLVKGNNRYTINKEVIQYSNGVYSLMNIHSRTTYNSIEKCEEVIKLYLGYIEKKRSQLLESDSIYKTYSFVEH